MANPNPLFTYQGSGLQIAPATFQIGPFEDETATALFGLDYFHDLDKDEVPETRLRPFVANKGAEDPCTLQFINHYAQNGLEWDMVFRIVSDPVGGAVGTFVSLDVKSNYPEIPMSINKFEISQPSFGLLKQHVLPADYTAEITFSYWDNGKVPAVDSWLMFEVSYLKETFKGELNEANFAGIPKVPIGRYTLLPSPSPTPRNAKVLGGSYR